MPRTPKNDPLFDALIQLDRLEELREELEELGIRSVDELEARIAELEALIGDDDGEDARDDDGPV